MTEPLTVANDAGHAEPVGHGGYREGAPAAPQQWTPARRALAAVAPWRVVRLSDGRPRRLRVIATRTLPCAGRVSAQPLALVEVDGEDTPRWIGAGWLERAAEVEA
jgi:hypothetical protein